MSLERFSDLVKAYGSNVSKWPADTQSLFSQYAHTRAGQALLEQESRVDTLVRGQPPVHPRPDSLLTRLYSIADRDIAAALEWDKRFFRIFLRVCLACTAVGIAVGAYYGMKFAETFALGQNGLGITLF